MINSKETVAALEYARELYPTFVPGTLSWLDPSNNKAFLAGQISLTYNGISIYYVAKTSTDPALKAIAADMQHAHFPVGPVGRPTELSPFAPAWVFNYTRVSECSARVLALHAGARPVRGVAEGIAWAISRSRCAPTSPTRSGPKIPSTRRFATDRA